MSGLYIHIPFCTSRCIYCGFYSTTLSALKDRYVDALCLEMNLRSHYLPIKDRHIETVYLGGGTPSTLSTAQLEKIFACIYKEVYVNSAPIEVTIECNPDDVTEDFAEVISSLPINRVSMGAQTFSDVRLKFLHRRHTANEVSIAVKRLRNKGIKNISIDLMYGFPNETMEDWNKDIDKALSLQVEHLSAYSLMIEEGTPLYAMHQRGEIEEIEEELSRDMYDTLIERMEKAGYEHYEISNFAQPGMMSKHNSSYWNATPYIGIGAASHSYDGLSRQWNISDINKYIKSIEKGLIPAEKEILDLSTRYDDMITTALRTRAGINIDDVERIFGTEYKRYLLENAQKFIDNHLMETENGILRISREGLFISDSIMSDLMHV